MPHIISHSYHNSAHPLFARGASGKKKGKVHEHSSEKEQADHKQNVPRSYESIKEAAGGKEQVKLSKKK